MGLKESGLRGSLRSTSSVLPAFFDVTITNTNSPVQEGDILTVDYSADNTGDAQDTQDIRLEIDSVEEDRDSDITLLGAQSMTGTLEWDTTDEDETTYTATVLSDDDTDSVTVEIEAAIPDSGDLHAQYDATEDGRSTGAISSISDLANSNDLTGSAELISNGINGNQSYRFDGVDDLMDVAFSALSQPNHVFVVAEWQSIDTGTNEFILDNEGTGRSALFHSSGDRSIFAGGSVIRGSAATTEPNIFNALFDGVDSSLRVDGSEDASGDAGGDSMDGFRVAANASESGFGEVDVGEILIYPQDKSGIQSDVESYLSDKWGITI